MNAGGPPRRSAFTAHRIAVRAAAIKEATGYDFAEGDAVTPLDVVAKVLAERWYPRQADLWQRRECEQTAARVLEALARHETEPDATDAL